MPLFDAKKCAAELFDSPLREILESYDRRTRRWITVGMIIIIIGICCFAFLEIPYPFFIMMAGALAAGFAGQNRRSYFRKVIIPELFKRAMPSLKYNPESGISKTKFLSYGLFNNFDCYSSEDKISGSIGKTAFSAAEIHLQKEHRDKNGNRTYTTIFRGVLFVADFNKHLNSRTVVLPDIAERCFGKLVGNFFQKMNFSDGSLVKLENPEFEKLFSVYSHDRLEARYILTPAMMEQLTALRQKHNSNIRIAFEGAYMALAIEKSSGWLEPPFFGKFTNIKVLEKILIELEDVLNIIEDLDLNTRIWTK